MHSHLNSLFLAIAVPACLICGGCDRGESATASVDLETVPYANLSNYTNETFGFSAKVPMAVVLCHGQGEAFDKGFFFMIGGSDCRSMYGMLESDKRAISVDAIYNSSDQDLKFALPFPCDPLDSHSERILLRSAQALSPAIACEERGSSDHVDIYVVFGQGSSLESKNSDRPVPSVFYITHLKTTEHMRESDIEYFTNVLKSVKLSPA